MNLHALCSPYTAAITPPTIGTLYASAGYTTVNYAQVPAYTTFANVPFDVQAMSSGDIKQVDALNIQGVMRAVYLNGNIEGLDRAAVKGGDVLLFGGDYWLVVVVAEPWGVWSHVIVAKQNGAPPGL